MPKNVRPDAQVIDPLDSVPSGPVERPKRVAKHKSATGRVPRIAVAASPVARSAETQHGPEHAAPGGKECPQGHAVGPKMKFCPACGSEVLLNTGPPQCRNGHEVPADARFCPSCGVPVEAGAVVTDAGYAPRDPSTMSEEELREREVAHQRAIATGRESPVLSYTPGSAPQGVQSVLIHFVKDGFTAFGNVWMRGQEIELWPGHPRWREAQEWIHLDTAAQYRRYGEEKFRWGPWPGERTYTAGLNSFQMMRGISDDGPPVGPPTPEELQRGDEAERRRGRRVPMPTF